VLKLKSFKKLSLRLLWCIVGASQHQKMSIQFCHKTATRLLNKHGSIGILTCKLFDNLFWTFNCGRVKYFKTKWELSTFLGFDRQLNVEREKKERKIDILGLFNKYLISFVILSLGTIICCFSGTCFSTFIFLVTYNWAQ